MDAAKAKMAPDAETGASTVDRANGPMWRKVKERVRVDGGQGKVACEDERSATGQQKTITRVQIHRLRNPFHAEPALAGYQRIAFDPLLPTELHGPVSTKIEAAKHVVARLEQREHIR